MMRNRQLLSGLLLILAFVSLQKLCYCDDQTVLYESFDEPFEGRWIVSKNGDYEGKSELFIISCVVRCLFTAMDIFYNILVVTLVRQQFLGSPYSH
ncbi:hypothetical protein F2Q70_00011097 [Brassica cretica]|uniref:Uncharacterized protein n=1 Tax=Brassica cretica TaxID=69181 RepID=A0A8S9M8H3_BRACR|nr:hypothetical protein F2Q70_00011097 [Brassica cretica]